MKEADKDEERALFHPVVQAKTRQHYKQLANASESQGLQLTVSLSTRQSLCFYY